MTGLRLTTSVVTTEGGGHVLLPRTRPDYSFHIALICIAVLLVIVAALILKIITKRRRKGRRSNGVVDFDVDVIGDREHIRDDYLEPDPSEIELYERRRR